MITASSGNRRLPASSYYYEAFTPAFSGGKPFVIT